MVTWDGIKADVEENGDVLTVKMEKLRDVHGASRLGCKVLEEIRRTLKGRGLGHVPQDLPSSQSAPVRLYKQGTPVADLINTVLYPGELNDKKLRELPADTITEHANIIQQIRELVAE